MISQSVITASLIGVVIAGVIPVIGGIILLAMGKIKGSSFWAGVLACLIGTIVALIPTAVIGGVYGAAGAANGNANAATELPFGVTVFAQILQSVCLALAMGICVRSCMKTRTFKAALSCGLGFAATFVVSAGISCVGLYITFSSINSGAFDQQYAQYIKMGALNKETVALMKSVYTEQTAAGLYQSLFATVFFGAALAAAGVVIMRFVCKKNAFLGMCAAAGILSLCGIGSVLPNAAAAIIVTAAIGVAALVFAMRMKDDIVPPAPVSAANDPFMASVSDAQNSAAQNKE